MTDITASFITSCNANRFDLMAKYLYIKYRHIDFYKELYHKHLITFNNCYEKPDGIKKNIDDFLSSFNKLIDDMKDNGFNDKYPIPIYKNKITNGAHRLMVSYFYNIQPKFKRISTDMNTGYNYKFLNRKEFPPLESIYADTMALEYCRVNKDIRSIIIYPSINREKLEQCLNLIESYSYIYYRKDVDLNEYGLNNLIKELCRGEKWIGGLFPKGMNPGGKYELCKGTDKTILLLVQMNDLNKCIELKKECKTFLILKSFTSYDRLRL